jgi:cysteinyl-tRNA synthetase
LDKEINQLIEGAFEDMSDDFNAPKAIARLFELVSKINGLKGGQLDVNEVSEDTLSRLKQTFNDFIFNILGFENETGNDSTHQVLDKVMHLVIDLRAQARNNKDWGTSDKIRDGLKDAGVQLKDSKEGTTWAV